MGEPAELVQASRRDQRIHACYGQRGPRRPRRSSLGGGWHAISSEPLGVGRCAWDMYQWHKWHMWGACSVQGVAYFLHRRHATCVPFTLKRTSTRVPQSLKAHTSATMLLLKFQTLRHSICYRVATNFPEISPPESAIPWRSQDALEGPGPSKGSSITGHGWPKGHRAP